MHIYCLFCQTQRTRQIAEVIQATLDIQCISPKIVQRLWVKGEEQHKIHEYLPGYLFLYSETPIRSFGDIRPIEGVFRLLGSAESGYELAGADRAFAEILYDMGGTLGILQGLDTGDRVRLDSELYHGFSGEITRLDRRKGRAQIEFDFDGKAQKVWVGLDIIRPEEPSPGEQQS